MRPFQYLEPVNLVEACSLLSERKEEAKIIAGGQSLLPILKQRLIAPQYIISIKYLSDLEYITAVQDSIKIGALTTHRAVETSFLIKERCPMLAEMEAVLAFVQVRNWGTLGGSLCHADPAGDPAAALIALGAKVRATSERGIREIPLGDFFVDYLETVLEPDEILTEIEVPYLAPHTGAAYVKEAIRFGDFPIISVAAVVTLDKDVVKEARIALAAAGKTPIQAKKTETTIVGEKVTAEVLDEVGKVIAEEIEPTSDVVASADYKREVAKVITRKAVSRAIERAR